MSEDETTAESLPAMFAETIEASIAESGQFVLAVIGDDPDWMFAYTIGNHRRQLPELLIICYDAKVAATILYKIGEIQAARGTAFADGEAVSFGASLPLLIREPVLELVRSDYMHQAGRFLETEEYAVRQVVLPDRKGRYPGHPQCDQPVLVQARTLPRGH
jgi:hypothetical protein